MNLKQIPLGPLMTNCYFLYNQDHQCIIFDPGADGELLIHQIKRENLSPIAIVLTHAHFDHIGAVDAVRQEWDIPVYIHENEAEWLQKPSLNGSSRYGIEIATSPAEHLLKEEGPLEIGPFQLEVLHTPGHSPGSISFYSKEANAVFSGDTIFEGGIGRTDLREGNHDQLISSIKSRLLTLPEETVALPGHGKSITIKYTKEHNPFLR